MPLLKGVGIDLAYYTTSSLPQPLSILCKLAPDFSVFKEVTALNINLLAQAITTFQNDLIKNEKAVRSPCALLWCNPCHAYALGLILRTSLRSCLFNFHCSIVSQRC